MKRFFVISCLLIFLFCTAALCESYSTYSTGHFSFKAPTTWLKYKDGDNLFLYGGRYKSTDGGMLMASESYAGQFEEVDAFYSSFVSGFTAGTEDDKVTSESILINNEPAVHFSFQYPRANPFPMHSIACYKGGYVLSISYADTLSDEDTVKNVLFDIAGSVSFSDELYITDEERIALSANAVYGDSLIASRAGKYPTIDVREYGSADQIRNSTNRKAFELLKRIRKYRDAGGMEFVDIRINVHTNVMDVYGNTSEKQVLGFNIAAEDIDKINFEKMPVDNIPKIAFNWYESPVMK